MPIASLAGKLGKGRGLLLAAAAMLLLTGAVTGTIAWLTDETPAITNTFGYADVRIRLDETDTNLDGDGDPTTNTYKMMPGRAVDKDPKVTVSAGTNDCWLFVVLNESENFDAFMTYEMAQDEHGQAIWTALEGAENVYWRAVDEPQADLVFPVLRNNQVLVRAEVTLDMLRALGTGGQALLPTLSIQAVAIQRDGSIAELASAQAAWQTFLAQIETTVP